MITRHKANNPFTAMSCLREGFKLLARAELRKFILIPVLINILLYGAAFGVCYVYLTELINQFIPVWLHWLRWLLWPMFFIIFFTAVFFTFTLLANLLSAPFYGKLSEQALGLISGKPVVIHDIPVIKVLLGELQRLAYLGIRSLPLLFISIIPGLNIIAPALWGLFGAWGMALEYLSYPLENSGLIFKDQKQQLKAVRFGALSLGGMAMLALSIPVLNIFVPPATVIGATVFWHKLNSVEEQA